jgi:bifunctional DNA-binding transcriptional regulator/antitoxin component of YhaV-PrlF toxin-antitoxin module
MLSLHYNFDKSSCLEQNHGMEQHHANSEKRIILHPTRRGQLNLPVEVQRYLGTKPESPLQLVLKDGKAYLEPVSMSLEDVFGAIELAEPEKGLDTIIEEAREEHVERFREKYN